MASQVRVPITTDTNGAKQVEDLELQLQTAADEITGLQDDVASLQNQSGGGVAFTSVPFSTALTFNGQNLEAPITPVTGPLAFTASGTVSGSQYVVPLRANGTNVPTFSSDFEMIAGSVYDNTANVLNIFHFWRIAGKVRYSIYQMDGDVGAIDVTAPTISSAIVSNATPTILRLTASEPLTTAGVTLLTSMITGITGKTVSGIAFNGTNSIDVTLSPAVTNGESLTFNLTNPAALANQVRDVAGNALANITTRAITNNVNPADVTPPTLVSAIVANATPTVINLTISEPLTTAGITLLTSLFAVSAGHNITGIAFNGTSGIDLTVDTAFVNGEAARTLAFTNSGTAANQVKDVAGNLLANFSGVAITNNVAASVTPLLLLHMDGANGSTTFTDSSGNGRTVTANGGAAISTAQSKFGGASADLQAVGKYLSLGSGQSWLNFTSNIFTIEFWIYLTSAPTAGRVLHNNVAAGSSGEIVIGAFSADRFGLNTVGVTAALINTITSTMVNNWTHIRYVGDGTNLKGYRNGVEFGATTFTGTFNLNAGGDTLIGNDGALNKAAYGFLDELSIWNVALNTGNFTPPTAPY